MENEKDYASLIPTEPPQGLFRFLQEKEGKFRREVLAFRRIGLDEAEAMTYCEDFAGDFRPLCGKELRGHKTALLQCSECCGKMLAEYIRDDGCGRYGWPSAGIRIKDDYIQTSGDFAEDSELKCPHCGEEVRLKREGALTHGIKEDALVAALTLASFETGEQAAGLPVLTVWNVAQTFYWDRREIKATPYSAFIVDGKRLVKLVQYRLGSFGCGYYPLGGWEQLKRATDDLGAPFFYNEFPCLDGTSLENAKLPEYYAQAYEAGAFHPLGYIRLYQRHLNAENLITAGMGKILGEAIGNETRPQNGGRRYKAPKLGWIRWKETRPAQMLGLTKEQLRQARTDKWGAAELKFWNKASNQMRFADAAEALRLAGANDAGRMLDDGEDPLKMARYLKKQKAAYGTMQDYRRMARRAGLDLTEEIVAYPPHLNQAHDRVMVEVKYKASAAEREAFARMSARCAGLCWERDGICIRPALTPEELVEEGRVLHHCVGGYARSHTEGKIILFIRHARRPERSWFTLNVNIKEKCVIQLHGYGNERSPKGKRIEIPREVKDFVMRWKEQVLEPWKLPREDPPQGGRTPGEAPEKKEKPKQRKARQAA